MSIKQLLTRILDRLPKLISQTVTYTNSGTDWEYIGLTFTVPANHIYVVRVNSGWSTGRPTGLGVHSSASLGSLANPASCQLVAGAWLSPAWIFVAGTYYVFVKRESVGTNTSLLQGLDYNLGGNS